MKITLISSKIHFFLCIKLVFQIRASIHRSIIQHTCSPHRYSPLADINHLKIFYFVLARHFWHRIRETYSLSTFHHIWKFCLKKFQCNNHSLISYPRPIIHCNLEWLPIHDICCSWKTLCNIFLFYRIIFRSWSVFHLSGILRKLESPFHHHIFYKRFLLHR